MVVKHRPYRGLRLRNRRQRYLGDAAGSDSLARGSQLGPPYLGPVSDRLVLVVMSEPSLGGKTLGFGAADDGLRGEGRAGAVGDGLVAWSVPAEQLAGASARKLTPAAANSDLVAWLLVGGRRAGRSRCRRLSADCTTDACSGVAGGPTGSGSPGQRHEIAKSDVTPTSPTSV